MKKYITTSLMLLLVGTGFAHAQQCASYALSYAVYTSASPSNIQEGAGGPVPGAGSVVISGYEESTEVCTHHLAGGDCQTYTTVYDSGNVSITVNGFNVSTTYGRGTTSSTIATALATAFNANANSPVNASVSGSVVSLIAKASGSGSNYALSATSANGSAQLLSQFGGPSFYAAPSGSALAGGANTSTSGHILASVLVDGSASMTVINTQYPQCQQMQQQLPSATHTPRAYNVVNGVGGWGNGSSGCVNCYISYQNNEDSGAVNVGAEYSFGTEGDVICSIGGLIYALAGPTETLRIAVSNYAYAGTAGSVCTYNLYCRGGYATCGYPSIGVDTPCPSNYFVAYYLVYRFGVNSHCFPASIGHFSSTPVACS
jgi:hypothetical protein